MKDLKEYLTTRMRQTGHSTLSLSEALGFSSSYISGIMNGQFRASVERLQKIAQYFNDDARLLLELAGYTTSTENEAENIARQISTLSPEGQEMVSRFVEFQKWLETNPEG